jgi:hypothetical protein
MSCYYRKCDSVSPGDEDQQPHPLFGDEGSAYLQLFSCSDNPAKFLIYRLKALPSGEKF